MKVRYQADADLNEEILAGVVRREPGVDFKTGEEANLRDLPDRQVLALCAQEDRVLVTHDRRTMPLHFGDFIVNQKSAGVLIIAQKVSVNVAIEELILIWSASDADEWINVIVDLPL